MKKIAKLLAYSLVALMLAGGIAGSAAAYSPQKSGSFNDNQIQYSDQYANSHVHQSQHVDQENNNHGGAVAVSVGHADRTPRDSIDGSGGSGGHASAWNINGQSNHNFQGAYSNAQNFNHQSQDD